MLLLLNVKNALGTDFRSIYFSVHQPQVEKVPVSMSDFCKNKLELGNLTCEISCIQKYRKDIEVTSLFFFGLVDIW